MDQANVRNFSIIAHIDHGKSTLADRILELTHAVDPRKHRPQVLDSMDLERERGITIKAQAVRVCDAVRRISAKTGQGVEDVLEELIARVPPPRGDPDAPARALIFDSEYDPYRGVVAYVRVVDGAFARGEAIRAMAAGTEAEIDDIG